MSFIEELKRRRVFRVAASYAVVAFIIMQLVEILFPMFNFPQWTQQFIVIVVLLGFPIAVILSWIFDKTPEGVVKTQSLESSESSSASQVGEMTIQADGRPFYAKKRNIFLVLGITTGIFIGVFGGSAISGKVDDKSIAVLPFDNYSTAPEDQYFSDGITEVIIAHLAKIKDFTVISRTSVMGYKGTTKSLKQIGKELGVAHILEGSVQRDGDEIRIVSQLIETKSDKHLWAETYDERIISIFSVQSDIAKKIALAMKAEISGDVERRIDERPTENIAAWESYLKGIEFTDRSNRAVDTEKAQEHFDKAFQIDPKFAGAIAKSANLDLSFYWLGHDHVQSRLTKAKSKIDKATKINPSSPEVLEATGYYYYYAYRDYPSALKYFNEAQKLEPGKSSHIQNIGYILRRQGKIEESLSHHLRALKINPNDASLAFQMMLTYSNDRDYSNAEKMIDKALYLFPDNQRNLSQKVWFQYFEHNDLRQLKNELYSLKKRLGDNNYYMTNQIVNALVRDRKYKEALIELDQVTIQFNIGQNNFRPYDYIKGNIYSQMGLMNKADSLFKNAGQLLEKELLKNPQDIRISSDLALIYANLDRQEDAMRMIDVAMGEVPIEKDATIHGAYFNKKIEVYLFLGHFDQALSMLKRSASLFGGIGYFDLLVPKWDPIRNEPEFQAVLKKLKPRS